MTVTGEELIYRYCMGMLNPNPEFYAGRGNSVRDLNSSILEMLYNGIKTEYGAESARMFVNMVKNLKNTNAQNFLNEYYRMEKKGWRWAEPVMKVRVRDASSPAPQALRAPAEVEYGPDGAPLKPKRFIEIANAFARSGSLFGHDKEITQSFLDKHKDEIESSAFNSSFGGE